MHKLWKDSQYREGKLEEVKEKIKMIQPHKPDFDDLIILGTSLNDTLDNAQNKEEIPSVTTTSQSIPDSDQKTNLNNTEEEIVAIAISNTEFVYPKQTFKTIYEFPIIFENYDARSHKLATEYLNLFNSGTVALRIYWKRYKKQRLFSDIIKEKTEGNIFHFNKNEFIILPKQQIDFPFWFKTKRPGVYKESWEISSLPKIWPRNTHVIVNLTAIANFEDLDDKCKQLASVIEGKIRLNLIKETLSSVMDSVDTAGYDNQPPIAYIYGLKEQFEAINSKPYPYYNRPDYVYDKRLLKKFEELYNKIKQKNDPDQWNYSLKDIQLMAKKYDTKNYLNENREILAVKETNRLMQLLQPAIMKPNPKKRLYVRILMISRTYFSKMCQDIAEFEEKLQIQVNKKFPNFEPFKTKEFPSWSSAEFFNDLRSIRCKTIDTTPYKEVIQDQLRPENLIELDDDPEKLYKACNRISNEALNAKKKKSTKNLKTNAKTKSKRLDSSTSSEIEEAADDNNDGVGDNDSDRDDDYDEDDFAGNGDEEDEEMDEFDADWSVSEILEMQGSELSVTSIGEEEEQQEEQRSHSEYIAIPKRIAGVHKQTIYLIIYRNLCKIAHWIEESIENYNQSDKQLRHGEIKRLEECDIFEMLRPENEFTFTNARTVEPLFGGDRYGSQMSQESSESSSLLESRLSLWSALKPYHLKPKKKSKKPISYPETLKLYPTFISSHHSVVNKTTSTEGGIVDPNWQRYKSVEIQKAADEEEEFDVVAKIEYLDDKTSVQDLGIGKSVDCQKNADEYVSDEEYFYDTPENKQSKESLNCEESSLLSNHS